MEKLNITKGTWIVSKKSKTHVTTEYQERGICSTGGFNSNQKPLEIDKENESNAKLIADAGTTYNQCGFLPSELKAQKEELLDMLIEALRFIPVHKPVFEKGTMLIQKYKSNE